MYCIIFTFGTTAMTVSLSPMVVLMKIGDLVSPPTDQSISGCRRMKFKCVSDISSLPLKLLWHNPGLGTGIWDFGVGSQLLKWFS